MKKALIEFVDYGFQYDAQAEPTLFAIQCTIYEGEKVLILGPSGSGKSSLAHSINGLIPFFYAGQMTGSLKIKGKETREMSLTEISNHVGTVLQDPDGQFVGLTVAEDIAFQLENSGMEQTEMKARVSRAAHLVGMTAHLDQAPHVLSGGQKQRTTLAGVMVHDVDVLLFDEPLANLDPLTGRRAIELIDQIHRDTGKTIVIVEHRLEDVLHRSIDRVLVVEEGRIIADVTPDELVSSAILSTSGIREPLYLSLMKQAGCVISPEMKPASLQSIQLNQEQRTRIQTWVTPQLTPEPKSTKVPLLEWHGIDFAYEPGKQVLHQVSFTVHQAEILCVVGNNGAGKSTISKLICGFYLPTAGYMKLNGQDIRSLTIRERAEHIGYVLQNPNQMISKTMVFEEVAMGLHIRGMLTHEVEERVHQVLRVCGLYPYRNWPISALSYGQKKRVTIASILVLQPKILILDEPTAGQDYKHYQEIMEFIVDLNRQGVAIMMITHDMHVMMEYADRALVLSDGKIISDDHPARVLANREVIEKANLKQTSLQEWATNLAIENPERVVMRYIAQDRRNRQR